MTAEQTKGKIPSRDKFTGQTAITAAEAIKSVRSVQ